MIRRLNTGYLPLLSGLLTLALMLPLLTHSPLHIHSNAVAEVETHSCDGHHHDSEQAPVESESDCATCFFLNGLSTPNFIALKVATPLPACDLTWALYEAPLLATGVYRPDAARAPPA